ncbi:phage portal protein family protein, partial [Corynebacterium ciconiae]
MAEIGHASPRSVVGGVMEDNWELRFPQSTRVYAKMLRQDAQVQSIMRAVTLPIRRSTWRVDPNGAPAEIVEHVAADLRLPVLGQEKGAVPRRRGRVSWDAHLQKALLALPYGHMFFEQVYQPGDDGLEHLVKLAPRLPGTVSKINVARDGGLESIEQVALEGQRDRP